MILLIYGFYALRDKISEREAIFIILFTIVGITENYILNAFICFPLLFLGNIIYKNKIGENKIERFNINNYTNV